MMVKCPDENKPGDRLIVTAPAQRAQQYVVTVPANVKSGQQFRVMINNQEVMVTCPRNVKPGQRVTFQLPTPQERPQQAAPNHQMFEVTVPEGVKPRKYHHFRKCNFTFISLYLPYFAVIILFAEQPFALIANGQKVMVTCPPNVKPGQKIRFQLPIQLSQQQLETFKVSYDKDGWMRCLGPDLKFHWVYNQADSAENNTVTNPHAKVQYDENRRAFVRQFLDDPVTPSLSYINATDYAIETSVKGLAINYTELNMIASQPFSEKCEWLKTQFANLRVPW